MHHEKIIDFFNPEIMTVEWKFPDESGKQWKKVEDNDPVWESSCDYRISSNYTGYVFQVSKGRTIG